MPGIQSTSVTYNTERILPHNEDAERAVLGSILLDNSCLHDLYKYLRPETFYNTGHAIIYKVMGELFEANQAIDPVTLTEALSKTGRLDAIGGASYLTALVDDIVTTSNVSEYAQILKDKYIARCLIRMSEDISQKSYDPGQDIVTIVEEAEKSILEIAQQKTESDVLPLKEIIPSVVANIEMIYNRKGSLTGLPTGFKQLNDLTGGFQKSDLIILAARPSVGKTSFALNVASNIATPTLSYPGYPVLIFSLEMSKEQIVQRMVCTEAGISSKSVRDAMFSRSKFEEINHAAERLFKCQIYIDDTPGISIMELRAKALRLKSKVPELGMIMIDYLQLMSGRGKIDSRQQEISEISRSLKALARELKIPVIALSQLNRAVEMRGKDAKPQLSDLRESGALEQDADVIMFLHRFPKDPSEESMPDNNRKMSLILAKQRNGPVDEIELTFVSAYTRFIETINLDKPGGMDSYSEYGNTDNNDYAKGNRKMVDFSKGAADFGPPPYPDPDEEVPF